MGNKTIILFLAGIYTANWSTATTAGDVQAYVAYYEAGIFKYVSTPNLPMATNSLQQPKAYRVTLNIDGDFNMSSVGGTVESESFNWADLMLFNGTDEKNITGADEAGWVFMDDESDGRYFNYLVGGLPSEGGKWQTVCGNDGDCTTDKLYPWTGYWIWSNYNDVIISRRY